MVSAGTSEAQITCTLPVSVSMAKEADSDHSRICSRGRGTEVLAQDTARRSLEDEGAARGEVLRSSVGRQDLNSLIE